MFDCHDDMTAFHNTEVQLPKDERDTMRDRRNTNRKRLKDGLKRDEEPSPVGCRTQGSYAMRTMTQHAELDYDIDDGVYFDKDKLVGPRGADKTAADAKEMVRKAVHDDKFKKAPEVLKNCVRIYYDLGYHVDVPVYRRFEENQEYVYELASTDWKKSDPMAVTAWFKDENKAQSPDQLNGGQMRRVVKLMKAFARSRESWRSQIAPGFMITKLVTERFSKNSDHDDVSLRRTMENVHSRLEGSLEVDHPVVYGAKLTRGPDDSRAKLLRDKLKWAIDELAVLDDADCSQADARKAWDKVFKTEFFTDRGATKKAEAVVTSAAILRGDYAEAGREAVDKRGGGRYG
ncbi:cyclic GMP-AMP synthase DncV-like nucleotidyltransferase [Mesorhizobium sp. NZP2077]|uniref:cyclic GMP-AMP synthase DncV-like nucleotidyltransferase n=1 Tax=Mesorhizobium sp. NZP2077 TaxID=2483404 RepID=UPI001557BB39|nr:hypothetical protein [Mesorhizobium sp. NZP2077]QKC86928.1 hypothetical protein EB232_35630 [Mesorhizobium sp. NZP2077]QKD20633.1 hypothetical protein HGP13_37565 [Mesorhizobium sp. NZP2077]